MSKNILSSEKRKAANLIAINCKSIISSYTRGRITASFTILGQMDDPNIGDAKFAVRNPKIEDFDKNFKQAIDYGPDTIVVKVFNGSSLDAPEIREAENTIRLTDVPEARRQGGGVGFLEIKPEAQQQQQQNNHSASTVDIDRLKFEADMEAKQLAFENRQLFAEKEKEIAALKAEVAQLKKDNKDWEDTFYASEAEHKDSIKSAGQKLAQGLQGVIALATADRNGTTLGVPNSVLAGILGNKSLPEHEQQELSGANEYTYAETEQIADFVDNLPEPEFEKVFDIFKLIAEPGNINTLHTKLISKTSA